MFDSVLFAEYIERMFSVVFHFLRKGKFRAVVRLNDLRGIAEERDRPFNEVNRAVGVLLTVRINKPFARGFVDYPVLISLLFMKYCFEYRRNQSERKQYNFDYCAYNHR